MRDTVGQLTVEQRSGEVITTGIGIWSGTAFNVSGPVVTEGYKGLMIFSSKQEFRDLSYALLEDCLSSLKMSPLLGRRKTKTSFFKKVKVKC